MPYPRVCEECGNEFVPDYKDHTYCSSECAKGEPNMNTAKHTPGPWVVRNMSDAMAEKFTVERLSNDGLRSVICRINDMEVCPEHGGTGSDANAHLIAAAPAMYEALRQAYAHLAEMGCDCEEGQSCGDCIVCQCETALAQAEGRDK